jgi:hypothetical protein
MTHLSELTPAEIYIITNENVTHQELLKLTFIDLLFKQVLKTFEVKRQPHIRQAIRIYKYVGIGQNFKNYKAKNHEKYFLSTFEKDNTIEILFRNLVKIGYQSSRTVLDFKNELIKSPALKKCFKQNIFQKFYYGYSFTEYGIELKRKIENEIAKINTKIPDLKNIENQKAIELIKVIGGNIFLLGNIDYDLLDQIDKDLATEINKNNYVDGGSGCSGCSWSFDDYSSSFDSGCSSGCSGCGSGCSGCGSGCSGCGGGCGGH